MYPLNPPLGGPDDTHYVQGTAIQTIRFKLITIIKNAKKQYLQDEIVNSRNDIRKFWTIVNLLIS